MVSFVLTFKLTLTKDGSTVERSISGSVNTKAYNKVIVWRATKASHGVPWAADWVANATALMQTGITAFETANHTRTPKDPNHPEVLPDSTKADILAAMGTCTAEFAHAHGLPNGLLDSGGYFSPLNGMPLPDHWMNNEEIDKATGYKPPDTTKLPKNMVIMYCCDTLSGGAKPELDHNVRTVDGCYLGFKSEVSDFAMDASGNVRSLAEHGNVLFGGLTKEGRSTDGALLVANTQFTPLAPDKTTKLSMLLHADPCTTLFFVYLTGAERSKYGKLAADGTKVFDTWFIVLE